MRNTNPILLIEDDDVDAMTVQRAFKDLGLRNQLVHITNGRDALEYLRNNSSTKPCIILLDLNMPQMDGIEFLKTVKADEILKMIPVVVLTTSKDTKDKVESFNLSVAGYMTKPLDYKNFVDTIKTIDDYWSWSELPNVQ